MDLNGIIRQSSTGKKVLALLLLCWLVYGLMILVTVPKVNQYTGGLDIFDLRNTGYTPQDAMLLLSTLGDQGRQVYALRQIPLDLLYPVLSGLAYCLSIAYLLTMLGKSQSKWIYLCYAPLVCALFDYLENIGILVMLNNYPKVPDYVVAISSMMTILKFTFGVIYFLILIVLLSVLLLTKILHRSRRI